MRLQNGPRTAEKQNLSPSAALKLCHVLFLARRVREESLGELTELLSHSAEQLAGRLGLQNGLERLGNAASGPESSLQRPFGRAEHPKSCGFLARSSRGGLFLLAYSTGCYYCARRCATCTARAIKGCPTG